MLPAHLGEELSRWPGTSGFHVFMTTADTFHGFLKILALPFQVSSQSFVERHGGVLAMPLCVFLELSFAFRLEGYHIHNESVGAREAGVKHRRKPT